MKRRSKLKVGQSWYLSDNWLHEFRKKLIQFSHIGDLKRRTIHATLGEFGQQQQQNMGQKKSNQRKISPFIVKLLSLLEDPQSLGCIQWISGQAFSIVETNSFSKKILPKYYKHHNISSFVRQLNIYGFTKLKSSDTEQVYSHPNFTKNNKKRLKLIQRKQHNRIKEGGSEQENKFLEENNVNIVKSLAALKSQNQYYKQKNLSIQHQIEKLTQQRTLQLQNMIQFLSSLLDHDLKSNETSIEQTIEQNQTVSYILEQFEALKQDKLLANEERILKMIAELNDRKSQMQQRIKMEGITSTKQLPESLDVQHNNKQLEPLPVEKAQLGKSNLQPNNLFNEDQNQFQNFLDNIF